LSAPTKYLLLLLALPFILFSCAKPELSADSKLAKKWQLEQIDGATTGVDTTDYLMFSASQKRFTWTVDTEAELQGDWLTKTVDDQTTVILVIDAEPLTADIDSAVLSVENNEPELILMSDGEEVSRIRNNELLVPKDTLKFIVSNNTFTGVTLTNGVASYDLKYTPETIGTGITFVGVLRGLLGIFVLLLIAWLCSANRRAISWKLVGKGLAIQIIFAILILKVPFVESAFASVSKFFLLVISFASEGTQFLFAQFGTGEIQGPLQTFAITVLPTIIFFSALTSLFYYLGILQKIVWVFAWGMRRVMKLSGAEALAAAGNIFLGQTETPLLIKPYLANMTKSEIMSLMTGGMATIAGGVLAAYIGFLGGDDPAEQLFFAKHLLAASVMSAPAAIVAAKILIPETEKYNDELKVSKDKMGSNVLEAIANGTTDGLKLAVNVAAMLLVFIALIAMGNYILGMIGGWTGMNEWVIANTNFDGLSFQFILGYCFAPVAWCMGVAWEDSVLVGQLLGEKTIINEFVAYISLGEMRATGAFAEQKSVIMSTYILCGFANFASIGIQIGGIGSLIPNRKGLLSKLGMRALIGGTLACLFTAVIVGMLM
jgi:CNT family concentrative nucleoside transporter